MHDYSRTWTNGIVAPDNASIAVNVAVETAGEANLLAVAGDHDFDPIVQNIGLASFGSVVTRGDVEPT